MNTILRRTNTTIDKNRISEFIKLGCRQIFRITSPKKGVHIQAEKGTLYITLPGDPDDHILQPGESIEFGSRGLILVQGLPEGAFRYSLS
jgi:hypothetical protein